MRAPPAVSVICGPDRAWRVFQGLLGATAGATAGAWIGLVFWGIAAGLPVAVASAAAGAIAAWWLSAQDPVRIAWTGAEWRLSPAAHDAEGQVVAAPAVMMDLGPWMLMRVGSPSGPATTWLSLSRRAAGPSWHLFRAAVYSFAIDPSPLPSEQSPPF